LGSQEVYTKRPIAAFDRTTAQLTELLVFLHDNLERKIPPVFPTIPACPYPVVDNELINRFLAQGLLEDAGFKVTLAESGEIALKITEEEKIDLILMDFHMPGLNGWDTTKQLRSSLLTHVSEIPIIGLTADILKESREKSIEALEQDVYPHHISRK
jgi:CheY-like chemotaxis protein